MSDSTRDDDWEEYYARQKRISERTMRELEEHRAWHDYVKFVIAGSVSVGVLLALDWFLN